jgi:uncharacterized Rmd1/YagE family protein
MLRSTRLIPIRPFRRTFSNSAVSPSAPSSNPASSSAPVTPPEPWKGNSINVKAYYAANSIDLQKAHGRKVFSIGRRQYDQRSTIITIDEQHNQYIAVFNYGSIVFFNVPDEEHEKHLKELRDAKALLDGPLREHTENYKVIIHQNLEKPSVVKAEHLNIRSLNVNNITIIGTIMAQSVALDDLASKVDGMFETFVSMNKRIDSGQVYSMKAKDILKLVAFTNLVNTNLLSKMGILEVTEAAWENADYTYTWEELRRDFEIEYRYRDIKSRVEVIKNDGQFFLEVLHHRNAMILETTIVFLISVEILQNSTWLLTFMNKFFG